MLINLSFFVYDDAGRHSYHRLHADTAVSSLAGFKFGQPLSITEQFEDSTAKNYVVADLPFRKARNSNLPGLGQAFDIYLALEEKWNEFMPPYFPSDNPLYGPTL
ncbi:hypothetical protein GCM10027299_41930 [Larkinella ripae]